MSIGRFLDDLRMRGKFNLLLVIQTLALVLVAGLGWGSVNDLQRGQKELASDLSKTATLSRVLNGMNIFRTLHVSMIGGAADPDYIALRETRLKEYSESLRKDLGSLQTQSWNDEEKTLLEGAINSFHSYDQGFSALLTEARQDRTPKAISRMMEGNV